MNPATAFQAQLQARRDADSLSGAVSDLVSVLDYAFLHCSLCSSALTPIIETIQSSWIEEISNNNNTKSNQRRPSVCPTSAVDASLTSEDLRGRGNEYFAQFRHDDAVRCYTRCIKNANENGEAKSNELLLAYSNRGKRTYAEIPFFPVYG